MKIKVTIKLDKTKIRVYLKGNEVAINEIENYLKEQGYNSVDDCIKVETAMRDQEASSYTVANYSMAYRTSGAESNKTLTMEAWFKIERHFTDESLATAIEDLVKPVFPLIDDDVALPKPNMSVSGLKNRVYVTVFEQDNNHLNGVLTLVRNFEAVVFAVRKQVGLENDKIPSDVNILFDEEKLPPVHAKGLKIFGLMPARANLPGSTPKSAYSTTSLSNTY